jgi:hypothetical protein
MHGEHHVQAPVLIRLALIVPVILFASAYHFAGLGWLEAAKLTALALVSYSVSLFTSIVLYRTIFHRLKDFPGPFMFAVSKLWHVYKLVPNSDNYLLLDKLHQDYGDFVRTGKQIADEARDTLIFHLGPTEISIFDPEAISVIYGPGTKCTKAPWYDATLPYISMHTLRDKSAHDRRRRIWDRGFGAKGSMPLQNKHSS